MSNEEENENNENNKNANLNPVCESVKSNVSRTLLQEIESGRPTEMVNNDVRYTEVDNDFLNPPIEGLGASNINNIPNYQENKDNEENKESSENKENKGNKEQVGQTKNNIKSPLYNANKKIYNLKIIVLGDIAVGKTSVIGRYITNTFSSQYKSSIGCELKQKTVDIDNDTQAQLQIWDTAGEERFLAVTKQYYNGSHGAMVMYDLTNKATFLKMNKWIKDIKDNAPKNIVIMVVGNKSDLYEIKVDLGQELDSFKENYLYKEVSAKTGLNVHLAFENLTSKIIEKLKEKGNEEIVKKDTQPLKRTTIGKKKNKCNC